MRAEALGDGSMSASPRFQGRVQLPHDFGRFSVHMRTDGVWIVRDPTRPMGQGAVWVGGSDGGNTEAEAVAACERISADATARGEPNERELKGWKRDWSDPRAWY